MKRWWNVLKEQVLVFREKRQVQEVFTDADQIHFSNKGVPVVFTGIPLRNMHNPGEVADMKDVEGCIELIAEFLCSFK